MSQVMCNTHGWQVGCGSPTAGQLAGNVGRTGLRRVAYQGSPSQLAQRERRETGVQPAALSCMTSLQARVRSRGFPQGLGMLRAYDPLHVPSKQRALWSTTGNHSLFSHVPFTGKQDLKAGWESVSWLTCNKWPKWIKAGEEFTLAFSKLVRNLKTMNYIYCFPWSFENSMTHCCQLLVKCYSGAGVFISHQPFPTLAALLLTGKRHCS